MLNVSFNWQRHWQLLLQKITRLETERELDACLNQLVASPSSLVVAFVNAHAMNCAAACDTFSQALSSADVIFRDGSGLALLFKTLNISAGINLNGTDLIPRIIQQFDNQKIALLGTQEPYLEQAKQQILTTLAPKSQIETANGFESESHYIELVKRFQPDLLILGMGMPKQELVAQLLRVHLQQPCLIVCGGAIIDFLGGKVQRAPVWMRQLGVEWLYRLWLEPRRLFMRYVIGNPLFIFRVKWFHFAQHQAGKNL
ncbi:MAG: glycosyltransferase [Methylomonas sp.]|nr:MAG: glycosyltransferase [Methylomonas sp.]